MKKASFCGVITALFMTVLFVFSSCADARLKSVIKAANEKSPVSLGIMGEITSVSYEDGNAVFLYTLNETLTNIDDLSANPEEIKTAFFAGLKNSENSQELLKVLIDAEAGLSFVIKGKDSGKEARFDFTPAELKAEYEKPAPTKDEVLQINIKSTNKKMPLQAGNGIVINSIEDIDGMVLYMAEVSSKDVFNLLKNDPESVKNSQKQMFSMMKSDVSTSTFFKSIYEAGRGFGYRYTLAGSTESIDILYSNEEVKEMFDF